MSIRFPYRFKNSSFGRLPDPTITVPVLTLSGWRFFDFLVDSGADVSMAPKSMADWMGVDLTKLPKHRSYGIEGQGLAVYHGSLNIRFQKKGTKIPCLFSSVETTPFLLGRAGLFDLFSIIFDNKKKEILFKNI